MRPRESAGSTPPGTWGQRTHIIKISEDTKLTHLKQYHDPYNRIVPLEKPVLPDRFEIAKYHGEKARKDAEESWKGPKTRKILLSKKDEHYLIANFSSKPMSSILWVSSQSKLRKIRSKRRPVIRRLSPASCPPTNALYRLCDRRRLWATEKISFGVKKIYPSRGGIQCLVRGRTLH